MRWLLFLTVLVGCSSQQIEELLEDLTPVLKEGVEETVDEDVEDTETENDITGDNFNFGTAPYAILHSRFSCAGYIKSLEGLPTLHISYLAHTFGNNRECLREVLKDDRLKSVQVHLFNKVCVRNKNCGDYEAAAGLSVEKVADLTAKKEGWYMQRLLSIARREATNLSSELRKGVKCYVSIDLESNLKPEVYAKKVADFRNVFGGRCSIVYNPVKNFSIASGADYLEHHEENTGLRSPCLYNMDGRSIKFSGIANNYPRVFSEDKSVNVIRKKVEEAGCEVAYLWHHSYNCITPGTFIDPRERKCGSYEEYGLTGELLKRLIRVD